MSLILRLRVRGLSVVTYEWSSRVTGCDGDWKPDVDGTGSVGSPSVDSFVGL